MSGIKINSLTVTQNSFRNENQISDMLVFVAKGGHFNSASLKNHSGGKDTRLINIVKFEDGRLFIHDGHHRIASIYLGGREILSDEEYEITNWQYNQYLEVNFDKRWITPFDPRSEVRVCDYEEYKRMIWAHHEFFGAEAAMEAIGKRKDWYVRPRRHLTIQDIIQTSFKE